MGKVIARHQEGISLNNYEYILDENNEVIYFETDEEAVNFLNENTGNSFTKEEWDEQGIYIIEEENKYMCQNCN